MNFLPRLPLPTILRCAELTAVAAAASATVKLLRAALNISASERVDGLGKDDYTSGFNRMRLNAYQIRALSLAAPPWSEAPAPVKPWLHFRGTLHGPPGGLFDPVVRLDYYPELVFHYAMSGAHDFYFFNPSQCKNETPPNGLWPVADDLRVLSESLAELTRLAGCAFVERNWVADTDPPRLRDHVMLTGMRLGPKESAHSLWRLTIPTRSDNRTAASLVSATATGALNVSGLSLQGPSGTQIGGCDLVLPGAQVLTAPSVSSELGVWIQQRHGAALPFTQCPGGWTQPWINASSSRSRHSMKLDDDGSESSGAAAAPKPGPALKADDDELAPACPAGYKTPPGGNGYWKNGYPDWQTQGVDHENATVQLCAKKCSSMHECAAFEVFAGPADSCGKPISCGSKPCAPCLPLGPPCCLPVPSKGLEPGNACYVFIKFLEPPFTPNQYATACQKVGYKPPPLPAPVPRRTTGHTFPRLGSCWGSDVFITDKMLNYTGFPHITNSTWARYDTLCKHKDITKSHF